MSNQAKIKSSLPSFSFLLLLLFFSSYVFGISEPNLNYRMDECNWDNDSSTYEILNIGSSGSDYNATAINGAEVTTGEINNAGDFNTKYMNLKDAFSLANNWSSTFWVKFPLIGSSEQVEITLDNNNGNGWLWGNLIGNKGSTYKVYVIGSVEGDGDIGLFLKNSDGDYRFAVYDNSSDTKTVDIPDLDDGWHFFAMVKNTNKTSLYIDGGSTSYVVDTGTNGDLTLVGTSTDESDDETIGATVDEFKIWNSTLSDDDISDIYDNEKNGKDYNGTQREAVICKFEPMVNYRMDECSWDNDDNTYEIKNYGTFGDDYNATAGNDANTTEGELCRGGDINSTDTEDKYILPKEDIPLPDSYTITVWINFPLNSDGHSVFSSGGNSMFFNNTSSALYYNIADRPGSSNDYIYYSYKDGDWYLCVADSDYECKSYNPNSLNGWHFLTFLVDGDTTKYFVDASLNLTFDQSPTGGNLGLIFNSDYGSSTDNTPNKQSIGSGTDEFKIFDKILTDSEIEDIYNNEKVGKNYDGASRECPNCTQEDKNTTVENYKFDAWDIFRDIDDRNISTKVVSKDFNLTVASLNEDGSGYQDFNGTVCAKIDNDISTLIFHDQNISTAKFKISKAIKDIRVEISWKKNAIEDCPLVQEDNSTQSSDNLAIRPKEFNITMDSSTLYAGEDFNISFMAKDYSDNNTTDYNETNGGSFTVEINETKQGCITGDYSVNVNFSDGGNTTIANYNEVGDINITIKEKNGSEFAKVDEDDTNDSVRLIKSYTKTVTVKPYDINITKVDFNTSAKYNWLYMDRNISENNVTLNITIDAYNKQGNRLRDFNSTCYAKDVNVTFYYDVDLTSNTSTDINLTLDGNLTDNNKSISDINKTLQIPKSFFISGEANSSYAFGVDRNYTKPLSPILIDLNETDISTDGIAKYENNLSATVDQNATFYYGRVKTKDISTNQSPVSHSLHVEIYSTHSLPFHQNSLNWYEGSDDNDTDIILLSPQESFIYNTDKNKSGLSISPNSSLAVLSGRADFSISNSWDKSDSAYIHVKVPAYLWYSRYEDYNDTNGSDCSSHPCFKYNYILNSSNNGIYSGDFNGSTIGSEYNATRTKIGVKVFR